MHSASCHPDRPFLSWLAGRSNGGKVYDLVPGAMIVIPEGIPHWMRLPAGGQLRYLAFKRRG